MPFSLLELPVSNNDEPVGIHPEENSVQGRWGYGTHQCQSLGSTLGTYLEKVRVHHDVDGQGQWDLQEASALRYMEHEKYLSAGHLL